MLKTAGITFGSRLLGAALSFILIVWISRWLGAEARGVCGLYLVIIAIITAISDIAGGAATPYLLNKYPVSVIFKGQMVWALVPSFVVPLFFLVFYNLTLAEAFMLVAAGWLNSTWSVLQQVLIGLKRFLLFNLFTIAFPGLSLGFFSLFYFAGAGSPLSYLYAICASWFGIIIVICMGLRNESGKNTGEKATIFQKEVFRQGFMNQLSHLASLLNSRLVFFILPAATLGLWANTLTICEAFFLIPGSFGQVAYGLMASNGNYENKIGVFRKAWLANLAVSVPGLLVMALLPDSFWVIIFGKGFSGITALLRHILPGIGMYSLYLITTYWQSASGGFRFNLYSLLAGLWANICFSAFFLLQHSYSLYTGISALLFGWIIASLACMRVLYLRDRKAFNTLFNLW